MTKEQIKNRIALLVDTLNYHSVKYYTEDSPEISDYEYDMMMRELKSLEKQYPEYRLPDSPTLRVGDEPLSEFETVKHKVPLKSLQDVFSFGELMEFDERVRKSDRSAEYVVELKIDGLSVAIEYKNGVLVTAATRGKGLEGENVTANVKTIKSIPLKLSKPVDIIVRGEVYMPHSSFDKLNKYQTEKGLKTFANPRNAAAGSLKQLDSSVTAKRNLDAFIFNIQWCEEKKFETHSDSLDFLKHLGFKVSPYYEKFDSMTAAFSEIERFDTIRNTLGFDIDGAVVKVNNITLRETLGETEKFPRWAVAYKYPPEQKKAKLLEININVGRTGVLTPFAIFSPINLAGTTVTKATLHNRNFIKELDIRLGDTVVVQKAGEIIPEIVRVDKSCRNGSEIEFVMPQTCPICGTSVIADSSGVAVRCPNDDCEAKIQRKIIHFASKDAMNIEGLGEKIVNQLVESSLISDVADLYLLTEQDVLSLEGFAEISAGNLIKAISDSKLAGLDRLLFGLGIRNVGQKAAKILAKRFNTIENVMTASFDDIVSLEDFGEICAKSVIDFFENPDNKLLVSRLCELGIVTEYYEEIKDNRFEGKIFVLSGGLDSMSRSEASAIIESYGGKISSSVSSKTNFLLLGDKPGSKLTKAKSLGIQIIEEPEFLEMIK